MKKIMKKTLCLLSSTVLLCGLTALPAGAKSLDPENSVKLEPELKTLKGHTFNPYRNTEFVLKQNWKGYRDSQWTKGGRREDPDIY